MNIIWFQLLMWHAGEVYWLGAWPDQDDCQFVQQWLEQQPIHAGDQFACRFVNVEET